MTSATGELLRDGVLTWALPADASCPAQARGLLREALTTLGMPAHGIDDALVMVSELATNALQHAPRGPFELWAYLAGGAHRDPRLVCKIFDTDRATDCKVIASAADMDGDGDGDAESGRGLYVVNGLSVGRWGCHLSRARLAADRPGKVVWFAQTLSAVALPAHRPADPIGELEGMLATRGVTGMVRADRGDMAVLSVRRDLTVWHRAGRLWWREGDVTLQRVAADIVDAAEEAVRRYEELRGDG
jgi:anti-sigma regulatory factor (Ser/Thr protein kinase)